MKRHQIRRGPAGKPPLALLLLGLAIAIAIGIAIAIAFFGLDRAESSSASSEVAKSPSTRDRPAGAARPSVAPVGAPVATASIREVWSEERARWRDTDNFAVSLQRVLAAPTAAGLFHAKQAILSCAMLPSLQAHLVADRDPGIAQLLKQCENVTVDFPDMVAHYRAARLPPEERALLDAADGTGAFARASIADRFSAVAGTGDPLVAARVALAWSGRRDATFDGRELTDEAQSAFGSAWVIAACTEAGTCESSVGAVRMCRRDDVCSGPFEERVAKVIDPQDVPALREAVAIVRAVLRSGDFSRFR